MKWCKNNPILIKLLFFLIIVLPISPSVGKYIFPSVILYISILFLYDTLINKIFQKTLFIRTFLHSIVYFIIFILGVFAFIYKQKYHQINIDDFFAIYQSNISEAYQFIFVTNLLYMFLMVAVVSYIVLFFLCLAINKYLVIKKINKKIVITTVVLTILNIFYINSLFSTLIGAKKYDTNIKGLIPSIYISYYNYKVKVVGRQKIASNNNITLLKSTRDEIPELHIVIVGESATSDHFSEYGYFFNTNPNLHNILKTKNAIKYSRSYSHDTHTMQVIPTIISEKSEGLLNIFNKGNVNTYWLSNNGKSDFASSPITALVASAKKQFFSPVVGNDSDVLLPELQNTLKNLDNNKKNIIFLHTIGSHMWTCAYIKNNLFKEKHEKIREKIQFYYGEDANAVNTVENISCYDQSILDTDNFIATVKNIAEKNPNFASLTYFSDHGEDMVKKGYHLITSTHNQVRIPFIIMFSNKYMNNNPEIIKDIKKHKDDVILNKFLFHTLQNIVGVKSANSYNAKLDISSNEFSPTQEDLEYTTENLNDYLGYKQTTEMKITDDPILILIKKNTESKKYWVHRVNSIGKLYDVAKSNPNGIELDIVYKDCELMVGHELSHLSGGTLDEYMEHTGKLGIKNMWLDIKNINKDNFINVKAKLDALSNKYKYFKKHALIETQYTGKEVALLTNTGYNVSYFLPHTKIFILLKENNTLGLKEIANSINQQIKSQNIKNVSFNAGVYDFVKNYLEKENNNLSYRVWPDYNKDIVPDIVINDPKVKVSLTPLHYRFEQF
jgi:heptose-I-phosphate ethanolaminephosphotransferase